MGAWGPGLFEDDTALDIRGDYEQLLRDKVPDDEAERRLIDQWTGSDEDELFWVALAVCESEVGRLTQDTKAKALEILDDGFLMRLYADLGGSEPDERQKALDGARAQLTGPQRSRKILRKRWRHTTDLKPGDLLTYEKDGQVAAAIVMHLEDGHFGLAPWVITWTQTWSSIPTDEELSNVHAYPGAGLDLGIPALLCVSVRTKDDPDYGDVGFVVSRHTDIQNPPTQVVATMYWTWQGLADFADRVIRGVRVH